MTAARDEVLGRIRMALRDVPPGERPDDVTVARTYRRSGAPGVDAVALFADRVADYDATVTRVPSAELADTVAARLAERSVRRLAVPADLPAGWLARSDAAVQRDAGELTSADLDQLDGVLTGCAVAVAETGTIVLDTGATQGRRALSLVPDYHLCVVRSEQVVASVPEAVDRLDPSRPLTWISGPSATSDIELSRVSGVHGPRTLDVLLVDGFGGAEEVASA